MPASPADTVHSVGGTPRRSLWWHVPIVLLLLGAAGTLAVTSLLGDSITYDETSHLTAGMSYLKTGDYRLAPDHPPPGQAVGGLAIVVDRSDLGIRL